VINKVIIVGNLGADPEVRTTNSGTKIANLRIATSERIKKGDQWEEHTEWHRVVVFGRTAEVVEQYAQKGRQLYIEGRIRTRKWQDQSGADRYSTEVIGDTVKLLGGKGDSGGRSDAPRGRDTGRNGGGYSAPDEDIPW